MTPFLRLVTIARPYNSLLPSLAVVVGFLVAGGTNASLLALAVAALFLLHSCITVWNDYEDRAVDELNGVATFSTIPSRRTKKRVFVACVGMAIGAVICAGFLPLFSVLALAGFAICGWIYNAAPYRFSRRPIGSIVVLFLAYGVLPFSIGVGLSRGSVNDLLPAGVLALSWGFMRVSLSMLKDYKDAVGDAKFGKRTFLLRYGATSVWQFSIGLGTLGFVLAIAVLAAHGLRPIGLIVLVATAGWLIYERTALIGRRKSYAELNHTFHRCLHYQLLFDGMVIIWLLT